MLFSAKKKIKNRIERVMSLLPGNTNQQPLSDSRKKINRQKEAKMSTPQTSTVKTNEVKSKRKTGRRKSQLDKQELRQLKEAFTFFDHDNDGGISTQEIGHVMKTVGLEITDEELKDIMNDLDEDRDGHMNFDEFVLMMDRRMSVASQLDELKATFTFFDKNGDGKIDFDELKQVLTILGEQVSDKDVHDLIKEADTNGYGYIDFEEFIKIMTANEDEHIKKLLLLKK
ncbi:calmodulin 2-like protein [Reticulomyxa filosa]|uniref:Calmodulin n=1 Tax=Reticulomyxa filosa TaxID=46433 RepID=X6MIQ3_RETFI|nr:calmodulin 2-like protein [Reticulomyxa filosa]|eukprot:ETO13322.1 calmodulin 2-like protein [Reticulomyxa filosa]